MYQMNFWLTLADWQKGHHVLGQYHPEVGNHSCGVCKWLHDQLAKDPVQCKHSRKGINGYDIVEFLLERNEEVRKLYFPGGALYIHAEDGFTPTRLMFTQALRELIYRQHILPRRGRNES